jgi:hypothetical protein
MARSRIGGGFGGSAERVGRGIIGGSPRGMRGGSGSGRGSARPIGSGENPASGSLRRSDGGGGG